MRNRGFEFEVKAAEYLAERGYRILARNQNYRVGEIDVIAELREPSGVILVFIEVRMRDERSLIKAEETISPTKQKRLLRAIQTYLLTYRGSAQQIQIDLIAFEGNQVRHFRNFIG